MQYTIRIFERMHRALPPLVPETLARSLGNALAHVKETELNADEAEQRLVQEAKPLWPYRRAFSDIVSLYEHRLGHRFVRAQLSPPLARRYHELEAHGADFRDVLAGPPKPFFSDSDHEAIRSAALFAWQELSLHAAQAALSVEKEKYLALVQRYAGTLREIERVSSGLRAFAAREPGLADEIDAFLCGVDAGLCDLGPAPTLSSVRSAHEHFLGRKEEKKMAR